MTAPDSATPAGRRLPTETDGWRLDRVPITHPEALLLVERVQLEYVARYGSRDDTPLRPEMFEPPDGAFFLGRLGDEPVATGAWRTRPDVERIGSLRAAEVKRMYVVPEWRRHGLARRMLDHIEATARAAGADTMILETGTGQPEGMALYLSSGYELVESFGHYQDSPLNRCYARRLGPALP